MFGVYNLFQFKTQVFGTLKAINDETKGLVGQLQKHQEAVDKMPKNFDKIVSQELSQGLKETNAHIEALKEGMEKTLTGFESLVKNFPHLDTMPQWLADVRDVIIPMKEASDSVIGLDEKILTRFNVFMESRGKVEESFIQATQAINDFSSEVGTHRTDIHDLVRSHLNKINSEAKNMQEPLAQIASFSDNNERLFTSLSDGLPEALRSLNTLIDKTTSIIESAQQQSEKVTALTVDYQNKTRFDRWVPRVHLAALLVALSLLIYITLS